MTDDQSLEETAKLLLRYPGITSAVAFRNPGRKSVHIRFRCIDIVSLKAIVWSGVRANVSIELGNPIARLCAESKVVPHKSEDLPCDITIPDRATTLPTQLHFFGAYLADDLERKGLISTDECHRLHSGWNIRLALRQYDE